MGEKFTYVLLTAAALFVVACGLGDSTGPDAPREALDDDPVAALPREPLPSAPQIIRVVPGDGFATLEWLYADSGSNVSNFLITGAPDGSRSVPGDVSSARVSGLTNGEEYTFVVRGVNESGFGPDSKISIPVLIAAPPGAPPAVAATELSEGGVRLAWAAPPRDGGSEITTYLVNSEQTGSMHVLQGDPTAGYALDGEPGMTTRPGPAESGSLVYVIDLAEPLALDRFRVAAANRVGLGQWSSWAASEPVDVHQSEEDEPDGTTGEGGAGSGISSIEDPPIHVEPSPVPEEPTPGEPGPDPSEPDVPVDVTPTPDPASPTVTPTPDPPETPGATITVKWLPSLYGPEGPPPEWQPTLIGSVGEPFMLHSIETWSTDPVDVFRADVDWGDGTSDQAWFEDPVYISSRTADGIAHLFAYHTYTAPGRYPVTITVSAINHSGVMGETTIEALID